MKEIDIRDPRSKGRIKTKICNYIKTDDGTELLEFKYLNFPLTKVGLYLENSIV